MNEQPIGSTPTVYQEVYWEFQRRYGKKIKPLDLAKQLQKLGFITAGHVYKCKVANPLMRSTALYDKVLAPMGNLGVRKVVQTLQTMNYTNSEDAKNALKELNRLNQGNWNIYLEAAEHLKNLCESKIADFKEWNSTLEEHERTQNFGIEPANMQTDDALSEKSIDHSELSQSSTTSDDTDTDQDDEVLGSLGSISDDLTHANQELSEESASMEPFESEAKSKHTSNGISESTNEKQDSENKPGAVPNTSIVQSGISHKVDMSDINLGDVEDMLQKVPGLTSREAAEELLRKNDMHKMSGVNIGIGNTYTGGNHGTHGIVADAGVHVNVGNKIETQSMPGAVGRHQAEENPGDTGTINNDSSTEILQENINHEVNVGKISAKATDVEIQNKFNDEQTIEVLGENDGRDMLHSNDKSKSLTKVYPKRASRRLVSLNYVTLLVACMELLFGIIATSLVSKTADEVYCIWLPNEIDGSGVWFGFLSLCTSLVGFYALKGPKQNICLARAYQILIIVCSCLGVIPVIAAFTYAGLLNSAAQSTECLETNASIVSVAIVVDIILGLLALCYSIFGIATSAMMCVWFEGCCPPTDLRPLIQTLYQQAIEGGLQQPEKSRF